jgi:WW domain-binding protein 11
MNPTDQARKEARRRELKKNKKQRVLVRNAVLKGKRPQEIIEELEKIDDMEYNPVTPCPLNHKVMSEKRRKLMETWDRVYKMYEKDAPDQFEEVTKQWTAYQVRKMEVIRYYESVMAAKDVEIEGIPLPNMSSGGIGDWDDESNIPLPPTAQHIPKSALKKPASSQDMRMCPGVPPGPPPSIQEYEETEQPTQESRKRKIRFGGGADEEEDAEDSEFLKPKQPNSLQKKMLEMAGQDLDQFMKEMEDAHKQKEAEKEASLQRRLSKLDPEPTPPGTGGNEEFSRRVPEQPSMPLRPGVPPQGVGLPPGPPPGSRMPLLPTRPGVPPAGVRMPPGPPPGVPPRVTRPLLPKPLGVLSAKPQINKSEVKSDSVIESKPVMRNLKSDVTRFIPTNLRIKRDAKPGSKKKEESGQKPAMFTQQKVVPQQKTKDDAYNDFMREMKDLL